MEGVHGYEPSIHKKNDNEKLTSYIYDRMDKKGRNDRDSVTWREICIY